MSLNRWITVVSWSALGLCALVAQSAHAQAPGPTAAGGLSVEAAVQRAVERSERAQIAELQVQSAEAHVDKARSFFLPDVTVSGTYTRRLRESSVTIGGVKRVTQDQNALNGSLVIGVTLFDGRGFPL